MHDLDDPEARTTSIDDVKPAAKRERPHGVSTPPALVAEMRERAQQFERFSELGLERTSRDWAVVFDPPLPGLIDRPLCARGRAQRPSFA